MSPCLLVGSAGVWRHRSIVVLGVYPPWWHTIGEYGCEGGVDRRLWRGEIWYRVLVDTLFLVVILSGFSCSTSHSGTDHHTITELTLSGLSKCHNFHDVHLRQVSIKDRCQAVSTNVNFTINYSFTISLIGTHICCFLCKLTWIDSLTSCKVHAEMADRNDSFIEMCVVMWSKRSEVTDAGGTFRCCHWFSGGQCRDVMMDLI